MSQRVPLLDVVLDENNTTDNRKKPTSSLNVPFEESQNPKPKQVSSDNEDEDKNSDEPGPRAMHFTRIPAGFRLKQILNSLKNTCCPPMDLGTYRPSLRADTIKQALLYDIPMVSSLPIALLYTQLTGFLAFLVISFWFFTLITIGINKLESVLIYRPEEPETARFLVESPSRYGFESWEQVFLKPDGPAGLTIHGYLLMIPDLEVRKKSCTILFFHGNAGNIGHRLPLCYHLYQTLNANIFMIDYRGYGRSEGVPSESGLIMDAQASLDFLLAREDLDPGKVVVFGRSLGAAVCIELCTKPANRGRILALMIENTFTSMPDIARTFLGQFAGPIINLVPTRLYCNIYPTLARLQHYLKVDCAFLLSETILPTGVVNSNFMPMLFLVGESDTLIPPYMTKTIASAYLEAAHPSCDPDLKNGLLPEEFVPNPNYRDGLVRFPNGNHNDTSMQPGWSEVVAKFIYNLTADQRQQTSISRQPAM